jgi:hypothetical protein
MPEITFNYQQNYQPFYTVFTIMIIGRFLSYLSNIYRECNIDIFFIDWEKPKHIDNS